MNKLHLTKVNPGNYSEDYKYCEHLKYFNNGTIQISNESVTIQTTNNGTFKYNIETTKQDSMSKTSQGTFEDGSGFRIVRPAGIAKQILDARGEDEIITFAGLAGDAYAVHFTMTDS